MPRAGEPMTFNPIALGLFGVTADVAGPRPLDEALFTLVNRGGGGNDTREAYPVHTRRRSRCPS